MHTRGTARKIFTAREIQITRIYIDRSFSKLPRREEQLKRQSDTYRPPTNSFQCLARSRYAWHVLQGTMQG